MPIAIACAPRRLMCVGAPPPIAAIFTRGNLGLMPVAAVQRRNSARIEAQPGRS